MKKDLLHSIYESEKKNHAFAVWREPGSDHPEFISSKYAIPVTIRDLKNHKGFTVFPFGKKNGWIIPVNTAEVPEENGEPCIKDYSDDKKRKFNPCTKKEYLGIFKKFHSAIENGTFSKLVLSRIRKQEINKPHPAYHYFSQLCEKYPSAFCYYLHLSKDEIWLGATPESLINFTQDKIRTVSLAGTQSAGPGNVEEKKWGEKEKEEQFLVTEFIGRQINKYYRHYSKRGPFTVQAGNILHLKTEFEIIREKNDSVYDFTDALQPTPAVCGIPKEEALEFILEEEGYERSLYTGFIGFINKEYEGKLFVNLRCFQLKDGEVIFYAGGGITKDSEGEKEWEETELKMNSTAKIFE